MIFRDSVWQEAFTFQIMSEEKLCCISDLQALSHDGSLHIFLKHGDSLYYREGLNYDSAKEGEEAWQAIASGVSNWYAIVLDGGPGVFVTTANGTVTGYKKTGNRWDPFFTYQGFITSELGAFPVEGTNRTALLTQGLSGSLNLITIEGQNVLSKIHHGNSFPFPKSFFLIMFIPQILTMLLPLILAIIFSAHMRRHRVGFFHSGSDTKPFASLTRRALAQIIDAVIIGAPLLAIGLQFTASFFHEERPFFFMPSGILTMLALILGGLLWVLVCLLVFSVMEGARGITPGKWVLCIRTFGTDLKYCGFWRALVRNLLTFVDGFFNFMVGVMVVALSENWQRVGDMAARTVVVDVREKHSGAKPVLRRAV